MTKGKVKYFNEHKGWGIIADPDGQQDFYVHYTAINMDGYKTLKAGQEVTFDASRNDHGPCAQNVTLTE
jgi:CspA family cold shock protein